jgi:hypothetical protein
MSKAKDTKKEGKKAPTKSAKEKKAAKEEKKKSKKYDYESGSYGN